MTRRVRAECGFVTVQVVVATGILLVLLVLLTNVLVDLYARSAIRGALDEGAHAGARHDGGAAMCERVAGDALRSVLGGPVGRDVDLRCEQRGSWLVAEASVRLRSWLPALVPHWSFDLRAVARRSSA